MPMWAFIFFKMAAILLANVLYTRMRYYFKHSLAQKDKSGLQEDHIYKQQRLVCHLNMYLF